MMTILEPLPSGLWEVLAIVGVAAFLAFCVFVYGLLCAASQEPLPPREWRRDQHTKERQAWLRDVQRGVQPKEIRL